MKEIIASYFTLKSLINELYYKASSRIENESSREKEYWSGQAQAYANVLKHLDVLLKRLKIDTPTDFDPEKKREDSDHLNGFRCTDDLYPEQ